MQLLLLKMSIATRFVARAPHYSGNLSINTTTLPTLRNHKHNHPSTSLAAFDNVQLTIIDAAAHLAKEIEHSRFLLSPWQTR